MRIPQTLTLVSKQAFTVSLLGLMLAQFAMPLVAMATLPNPGPVPFSVMPGSTRLTGQVSVMKEIHIAPESARVSMKFRDTPVKDILNSLAKQGGFNILIDNDVEGSLTVDVNNITINKALHYIFQMTDLSYTQDGRTLLVASRESINEREMNAKTFKTIPVKYRDASRLAGTLNQTLFRTPRAGASANAIASFDQESNSLIVMGGETDILQVEEALKILDVPHERRVYRIQHNDPNLIMTAVSVTLFPGQSQAGGGGAAGGAGGGGAAGGAGGGGAAGGAGGGGAAGGAGGGNSFTAAGFTMVSNRLNGTLTIMGTPELMELADKIIRENDVERPQVMIEVALIEVTRGNAKTWDVQGSPINSGAFSVVQGIATTGQAFGPAGGRGLGVTYQDGRNLSNSGSQFGVSLSNSLSKGKLLANPTIVAQDGTTSNVNIQDQLVYFTTQTTVGTGGAPPTVSVTANTVPVGIQLSITPQITNDGMVHMMLNPTVTQLAGFEQITIAGTVYTAPKTSNRTMSLQRVRVRDGETLILGGLLRDTVTTSGSKIPGLSDLPIIGAMFRTSDNSINDRTEVIVMVTPHILKDKDTTPYYFDDAGKPLNADKYAHAQAQYNGMVQQRMLPKLMDTSVLPASAQPIVTEGNATVTRGSLDLRQPVNKLGTASGSSATKQKAVAKATTTGADDLFN
jgi:general secretion pathway protein D